MMHHSEEYNASIVSNIHLQSDGFAATALLQAELACIRKKQMLINKKNKSL